MGVGSDSTNETEENKFVDVTKHSDVTEDNVFISKSSSLCGDIMCVFM